MEVNESGNESRLTENVFKNNENETPQEENPNKNKKMLKKIIKEDIFDTNYQSWKVKDLMLDLNGRIHHPNTVSVMVRHLNHRPSHFTISLINFFH